MKDETVFESPDQHEALQRDLATVCIGRFEPYRHKLAISTLNAPGLVSGLDLVSPEHLDRTLAFLAKEQECDDPRVLASLWTRLYGDVVIPAVLVANLMFRRDLPIALDRIRFAVDAEGKPSRIVLADAGGMLTTESTPTERFKTLVNGNLGPVVDAIARHGSVSPRMLWGNLASYFEWTAHVLIVFFDQPPEPFEPLEALLNAHDHLAGPMRDLVEALSPPGHDPRGRDPRGLRWRRVCCIRYLIPALSDAYCINCPIRRRDDGRVPSKVSPS
ncbi:siderophore-iron reductase FhuF [Hwanghaeella sp. LZ110]|uniref:siderophore-iron reductase FhuF n=1 Tax=Hwanghaeella sp. LZ110 TaxID=3402810 RepID=UPI003B684E95